VPSSVIVINEPTNGTTTVNSITGEIIYTPNTGFYGIDTFTYQVCDDDGACDTATVTITVNGQPIANDDSAITDMDTPTTIAVLANDYDPDGDPLTVIAVGTPMNGVVIINSNNTLTYTPTTGFYGADTFTYTISDGRLTATATVTVRVNAAPVAVDDMADAFEDLSKVIVVLGNDYDPDGDPLTVISVSVPANGSSVINIPGYTITYTPKPNFNGADTFTYTISDGRLTDTAAVTVTVFPVNDPPVANNDVYTTSVSTTLTVLAPGVLGNDTNPDGDPLVAGLITYPASGVLTFNADGSFSYTPAITGTFTFTYRAYDPILTPSNTATVSITVSP